MPRALTGFWPRLHSNMGLIWFHGRLTEVSKKEGAMMMQYPKYKKVLFCTDFSESSDHAFSFAYGVAKRDRGVLYILHVVPDVPQQHFVKGLIPGDLVREAEVRGKEDMDKQYKERYVKNMDNGVPYEIVTKSGSEDGQIIEFAEDENIDLIVIGTRGRTGINHVFFGSVAEKVIRHSHVPVLVIPCSEKRDSE
jgi:nucleotide-binding universal stress UspA family protein